MKKILCVFFVAFAAVALFSCARKQSDIVIGAALLTQSHPFYQAMKTSLEAEAKTQGVDLIVTIADQDLNRQISQVEDFINRKVNAIIITPVDSDGIAGGIAKAKEAGIPVVTVDIKANGAAVDTHVATDNYTGGRIAAEAMAQYLGERGTVGLITYPELQSVRDRIQGFKDQIKNYENITVVTELPGRTREEARSASEDMLTAYSDLNGIFGFGDDMAIAATLTAEQRGLPVTVVGFDGLQEARDFVDKNGAFKAVVRQFPEKMGQEGVRMAIALVRGESVPAEIPIVPGLYVSGMGEVAVQVDNGTITLPALK